MKFKVDENLPIELVADLHAAGHDVRTLPEQGLGGTPDQAVMEKAGAEGRVLLTMDKGFANPRVYPPERYAGIILLRPRGSGRGAVLSFARQHLPTLLKADLAGHLFVVSERGIRVR